MSLVHVSFLFGYFALFCGSVAGLLWWRKKARKTRLPFGEDIRLVRQPGETQLAIVRETDEDALPTMLLAACCPALLSIGAMAVFAKFAPSFLLLGIAIGMLIFAVSYWLAARWVAAQFHERANRYLGYFGERIVAENLEPLKREGWFVFHDVPGVNNGAKFNIDHVAVGPQGVFAIETKTRRKGRARPGYEEHKVIFDGRVLDWPWGEDNHGLEQAERNALWLADALKADLGERVHVAPVLTLPGWFVENRPSRHSRIAKVANAKALGRFISAGPVVLSERQIAAIGAKLEARCRDVEY